MTYQTEALNKPGLVAGYMLNDSGPTDLLDFGPHALHGTKGANGTLATSASGVIPEASTSLQVGTAASAGGSVAAPVGSPLRLTTGVTLGVLFKRGPTIPASGIASLGGRKNNWTIDTAGGTGVQFRPVIYIGGSSKLNTGRENSGANVRGFAMVTWDQIQGEVIFYQNGEIDTRADGSEPGDLTAVINATADSLEFGSVNGANPWYGGFLQGFVIYDHALTPGDYMDLFRAADSDHTIERTESGAFFDFAWAGTAVVDSDPTTHHCGKCTGRINSNEPGIVDLVVPKRQFHPICHKMFLRKTPRLLSTDRTVQAFVKRLENLGAEYILGAGRRPYSTSPYYHDGTDFRVVSGSGFVNALGLAEFAAFMHRYHKGGKNNPYLTMIRKEVALAISSGKRYQESGIDKSGNTDFVDCHLGGILLNVTPEELGESLYAATVLQLSRAADTFIHGYTPGADPLVTPSWNWYANGNRNLLQSNSILLAYMLTGNPTYLTYWTNSMSFNIAPDPNASGASGVRPGKAEGFGLVNGATGGFIAEANILSLNKDTDAAYFVECNMNQLPMGCDYGYTALQVDVLAHAHQYLKSINHSDVPKIAMLMNLLRNHLAVKLDRTTYLLDNALGTRHPGPQAWSSMIEHLLMFELGESGAAPRTIPFTAAQLSTQFKQALNGYEYTFRINGMKGGGLSYYRAWGLSFAPMYVALPDWPGWAVDVP